MNIEDPIHAVNRAFARDVRAALDRAAEGPSKDEARAHLHAAFRAEYGRNEADWLLGIERAARALSEADERPPQEQLAQAYAYFSSGRP